jgi:hypothetical protein
MTAKFYVLMLHTDPGAVLTLKPVTKAEAEQVVRWQCGVRQHPTYPVCTYNPETKTFDEVDGLGRRLTIHRGPYTEAAHAEFMASLPG